MRSRSTYLIVSVVALLVVGVVLFTLSRQHAARELAQSAGRGQQPRVTGTRPAADAVEVPPTTGVIAEITLPNTGAGVDARTLDAGVSLVRVSDGQLVPAHRNTSGAGDIIVLKPDAPLDRNQQYRFIVTADLKDTSGASFVPYTMTFRTAETFAQQAVPVAFEKVEMPDVKLERNAFTSMAIGPDGKLYAGSFAGLIYRFTIQPDGTLADREQIMTVLAANRGPRLVTGIAFDPKSTASEPILWVNHGQMAVTPEGKLEGADDWTGKLSRLSGPMLDKYEDVVINLPRAYKDHLNFQIVFDRTGALYFTQGSHTSVGEVDKKWGYRPERKLSAALLRLDLSKARSLPIDAKTEEGGAYDPSAPDAPLTLFATGIRSGFDLLFHRNGHLYCGVNGAAGNEGNTPASPDGKVPAVRDLKETTDDVLIKIEPNGYYGHPNPVRGEYVLNGGNPTEGVDPMEVKQYPVGVQPDPRWKPPAFVFGKNFSPNGLIEYRGGALDGCILVTRYSDGKDILVLKLNADGDVVETIAGIDGFTHFNDPLDLVQDEKTGNIYVAEYAGQKLTLLRPLPGKQSTQAQITTVAPPPAGRP